LRLLQQNVGGALPGIGTMAMYGMMRYTNAVFAEDEEGLPAGWEPFNTERFGYAPGTNSVAVNVCSGANNIIRRGIGTETLEFEAEASLLRVASYMRAMNVNCSYAWPKGTPGIWCMSRPVAKQLAGLGWTKQTIKEFVWKHARIPVAEMEKAGMPDWLARVGTPRPQEDPWPVTRTPEQIALVVAGGYHPTHNMWMQTSISPEVVHEPIKLPKKWDELVKKGAAELGYDAA
jgi:hypothetical protein